MDLATRIRQVFAMPLWSNGAELESQVIPILRSMGIAATTADGLGRWLGTDGIVVPTENPLEFVSLSYGRSAHSDDEGHLSATRFLDDSVDSLDFQETEQFDAFLPNDADAYAIATAFADLYQQARVAEFE